MWSILKESPVAEFQGAFYKQVRSVSHGRPLLYCNGAIHMMQLLVCYANHFVELIEIFPSVTPGKSKETAIER